MFLLTSTLWSIWTFWSNLCSKINPRFPTYDWFYTQGINVFILLESFDQIFVVVEISNFNLKHFFRFLWFFLETAENWISKFISAEKSVLPHEPIFCLLQLIWNILTFYSLFKSLLLLLFLFFKKKLHFWFISFLFTKQILITIIQYSGSDKMLIHTAKD